MVRQRNTNPDLQLTHSRVSTQYLFSFSDENTKTTQHDKHNIAIKSRSAEHVS